MCGVKEAAANYCKKEGRFWEWRRHAGVEPADTRTQGEREKRRWQKAAEKIRAHASWADVLKDGSLQSGLVRKTAYPAS